MDYFLGNAFHYGRTPGEIDAALNRLKSQGADFIKAYLLHSDQYAQRRGDAASEGLRGLNPANLPYLVQAARRRGLRVVVHVENAADLRVAADARAAVAAHLPLYGGTESVNGLAGSTISAADARRIARSGMLLVPTYALAQGRFQRAQREGRFDAAVRDRVYAVQAGNVRRLLAAGGRVLAGTDTGPAIFDEMEHLVAIGAMTSRQAAQVAFTTGRALFPRRRIGCFDPGCEADFLSLEADPTIDIRMLRRIRLRIKAGREADD